MNTRILYAVGAILAIGVITPLWSTKSFAADPNVQQGPPPGSGGGFGGVQGGAAGPRGGFQGQGFPAQGMPMQFGGGGGGGTAMVSDNGVLFIVQGNMVYKVNKNDLKVAAMGELPRPQPQRPGQPPRDNAPPPPPKK